MRERSLEPIGDYLRDDLVEDVATGYGSVVSHLHRIIFLGDQSKYCGVQPLR